VCAESVLVHSCGKTEGPRFLLCAVDKHQVLHNLFAC
jgi:hypothetical protein